MRTHAFWAFWVILVSVIVYPPLNWWTGMRATRFHLYFPLELHIPLIPLFIWPYLSMYIVFLLPFFALPAERVPRLARQLILGVFISGLGFLFLPAELGFVRMLPEGEVYRTLFGAMFRFDRPHNLVPSLHVIYCGTIVLACADVARAAMRAVFLLWLAFIIAATVFVHQHHLIDVATALGVVAFLRSRFLDRLNAGMVESTSHDRGADRGERV